MTVSTIYAPIEYAGDASTVAFPVPWMFLEADDLRITKINDATDAETAVVTFTTSGTGEPTGGTVVLPAAIGTGYTLRIERRTDRTQEMDLQPQGRFPAETVERSVDKLTLIVQELEESIGTGGTGSGTAIETIVTDDPSKVEITKTGTEVTINVLATNPTGPAGGDLTGTYPDPILKQGTGVGSLLLDVETDFSWAGWAGGSTLGGRGIAAGYAWFGDPGSQVHLPVWGANDAYAIIRWSRDFWATTVQDSSLAGIIGVGVLDVKPPCMAYVEIGGVWCWVLTSDSDGRWWYAQDIAANYNSNGSLKTSAWVAGTTATRVMADIAQSTLEGATCMVGNHGYIIRTTDWATWTDVYNTGGSVLGGIATDNAGTWIAIERDTGKPIRSTDGGLTWTNPTVQKRTGESGAYASATTLIPTGTVVHGNGMWLITGATSYAYSPDGLYWTVENAALGSFYGVGFDGVRYFATNPNNGTDPAIIYQLLVSSIPFRRQVVAERGMVVGGDAYFKDLPNATAIGTNQNGKAIPARYNGLTLTQHLDATRAFGESLLQFIPYEKWAETKNGTATTYDSAEAIQEAHDQLDPWTTIWVPEGQYRCWEQVNLTKPMNWIGPGADAQAGGALFVRRANKTIFKMGDSTDGAVTWRSFSKFHGLGFWDALTAAEQAANTTIRTADFVQLHAGFLAGFDWCVFNGDHQGAWLAYRRAQDTWIENCLFRGGGQDLGSRAQIFFDAPQDSGGGVTDIVNEVKMSANHHEWILSGGGVFLDPVTGVTAAGTRGVVAIANAGSAIPARANGLRNFGSKFECLTSTLGSIGGDSVRRSAIELEYVDSVAFVECVYNQTARIFDIKNSKNVRITGRAYYGQDAGIPDRRFGKFEDVESLRVDVFGYDVAKCVTIRCPKEQINITEDVGIDGVSKKFADDRSDAGLQYLSPYFDTVSGTTLESDIRSSSGLCYQSRVCDAVEDYGIAIMSFYPTNRKFRRDGMTLRVRMCTKVAPVGAVKAQIGYAFYPNPTRYRCDGSTVTFAVPRYFAPDTDGVSVPVQLTAHKIHRTTGVETAVTISSKTGEGAFDGGTATIAETLDNNYDIEFRRAGYGKSILVVPTASNLSEVPGWYEAYIPPGVLLLENVVLQVLTGWYEANLQYQILEWDLLEHAQCPTIPYYPARVVDGGPGLVPGGNGWVVGSEITTTSSAVQGGRAYVCTSPSANNGVGAWRLVTPELRTTIYTGAGGSDVLPLSSSFLAPGCRQTFINNGTGALTINRQGSDTVFGSSATSWVLGIGESAIFEHVGTNLWSIVSGVRCSGGIHLASGVNPTQAFATGSTPLLVTVMQTDTLGSINLTPAHGSDRVTLTRFGQYEVSISLALDSNTVTLFRILLYLDGVAIPGGGWEYYGATGQAENVTFVDLFDFTSGAGVLELKAYHNNGGTVTPTFYTCSMRVKRVA